MALFEQAPRARVAGGRLTALNVDSARRGLDGDAAGRVSSDTHPNTIPLLSVSPLPAFAHRDDLLKQNDVSSCSVDTGLSFDNAASTRKTTDRAATIFRRRLSVLQAAQPMITPGAASPSVGTERLRTPQQWLTRLWQPGMAPCYTAVHALCRAGTDATWQESLSGDPGMCRRSLAFIRSGLTKRPRPCQCEAPRRLAFRLRPEPWAGEGMPLELQLDFVSRHERGSAAEKRRRAALGAFASKGGPRAHIHTSISIWPGPA